MASEKTNLLLLFDRPQEPVFVGKGDDKTVFEVPNSYLTDRYKPIGVELANRFGEEAQNKVSVSEVPPPNLTEILELGRHDNFSLFIPKHRRLAGRLIDIFMAAPDTNSLLSTAVYARDRINPYLFNYAFSVALLHREDTQDLDLPSFVNFFPDKFLDAKVFARAREEISIVPDGQRVKNLKYFFLINFLNLIFDLFKNPIEIPRDYTASNLETEHRLAYFREDLGINLHHWHWHLVYPFEGADAIVRKNRRGELFYYMHQQIIARYNFERLCNDLKRVRRFNDLRSPIEEAYFPKLDSLVASRAWPARVANQKISDLNRPVDQISQDVDDLFRWRDRIFAAIHSGIVTDVRYCF